MSYHVALWGGGLCIIDSLDYVTHYLFFCFCFFCWLKVNPTDQVLYQKTDRRGYPPSCGTENKEKDVIIIVKGPVPKPDIGEVRDLSKGE